MTSPDAKGAPGGLGFRPTSRHMSCVFKVVHTEVLYLVYILQELQDSAQRAKSQYS
jgi:hypothetical protein